MSESDSTRRTPSSPLDPLRHALTDVQSTAIFTGQITPLYLEAGRAAPAGERPRVLLLGGQTGAGKSRTRESLTADPAWDDAVEVGSDIFRAHHPAYRDLLRQDPVRAALYTDHDARRWVDQALSYAANHRLSVIFDSTLSRPAAAETITGRFREAGYHLEVAIVAAPAAVSRLSVIDRYQTALLNNLPGRYSLNHDETYDGVLQVAELLDRRVLADIVSVYRRGGTLLHQNTATVLAGDDASEQGQWRQTPTVARTLQEERTRPWTNTETAAFLDDVRRVTHQAATLNQGPSWYRRIGDAAASAAAHLVTPTDKEHLAGLVARLRIHAAVAEVSPRVPRSGPAPGGRPHPPGSPPPPGRPGPAR